MTQPPPLFGKVERLFLEADVVSVAAPLVGWLPEKALRLQLKEEFLKRQAGAAHRGKAKVGPCLFGFHPTKPHPLNLLIIPPSSRPFEP